MNVFVRTQDDTYWEPLDPDELIFRMSASGQWQKYNYMRTPIFYSKLRGSWTEV